MNRIASIFLSALLLAPSATLPAADASPAQPNILVLIADDLARGEWSCQGNPAVPPGVADELPGPAVSHVIQHLPNHDARAFEGGFPVADGRVGQRCISPVRSAACPRFSCRQAAGGMDILQAGCGCLWRYPPSQTPGSFNLDKAQRRIEAMASGQSLRL